MLRASGAFSPRSEQHVEGNGEALPHAGGVGGGCPWGWPRSLQIYLGGLSLPASPNLTPLAWKMEVIITEG